MIEKLKIFLVYSVVAVVLCSVCFAVANDDWTVFHSVPGVVKTALNFDGTQDFINLPTLEAGIENDSQGSIATWIKLDTTGASETIFCHTDLTDNENYLVITVTSGDLVDFSWRTAGTPWGADSVVFTGNTTITADPDWHFIVLTSDGSTFKLYVNAVLQELTPLEASENNGNWFADLASADYSTFIGKFDRLAGADNFFNGDIDNVMIFNIALTQSDVSWLYNGGGGRESLSDGGRIFRDENRSNGILRRRF